MQYRGRPWAVNWSMEARCLSRTGKHLPLSIAISKVPSPEMVVQRRFVSLFEGQRFCIGGTMGSSLAGLSVGRFLCSNPGITTIRPTFQTRPITMPFVPATSRPCLNKGGVISSMLASSTGVGANPLLSLLNRATADSVQNEKLEFRANKNGELLPIWFSECESVSCREPDW